jgi:hypothetical protein
MFLQRLFDSSCHDRRALLRRAAGFRPLGKWEGPYKAGLRLRQVGHCEVFNVAQPVYGALGLKLKGIAIMGRGILLWLLGVPIPIILLLAMCSH